MTAPDATHLYETAAAQEGYFSTGQAAEAGYSRPLLHHHIRGGRFLRIRRGIYRLVQYPSSDNEDLVVAWLWSATQGVASHETALSLHHLSDVLPAHIHLTVPSTWKKRRLVVPPMVLLYHADLLPSETTWFGAVPVTTPLRTIRDCIQGSLSPDMLHLAIAQGIRRGLFSEEDIDSSKVET